MTTEVLDFSETTTLSYGEDATNTEAFVNWESTTTQNYGSSKVSSTRYDEIYSAFNILEIVMTSLELMLWIGAAIKMPRWRNNYRNQMLMQLSVARFIKRLVFTIRYYTTEANPQKQETIASDSWENFYVFLSSAQIYIDFVIVILVFFFIKHMYDTLIIVLVKCRQNSLHKVSMCAWLLPAPISAVWTAIIVCKALDEKLVYLIICCVFRWPLIFIGTAVYITVLYRVLTDKIRKFARSLTVLTFFMCLVINFYLFSKDVIKLWCFESQNTTLISYVSGFVMNFLILTFYILLIALDCKQSPNPRNMHSFAPDYSLAEDTLNKI